MCGDGEGEEGGSVTTLAEHAARIEEMKAAEKRLRAWVDQTKHGDDIRLLLERIDAYEASITWHTDCLTCPKLYDQIYALHKTYEIEQHTIPELRAALAKADVMCTASRNIDGYDEFQNLRDEYRDARAKVKP